MLALSRNLRIPITPPSVPYPQFKYLRDLGNRFQINRAAIVSIAYVKAQRDNQEFGSS